MAFTYKTITQPATGEYREKGSKFLAYAFHASTEEVVKAELAKLKELHPKSRHYCYAYRLDLEKKVYRANDDGEPSGTAGKPILGQIDSFGLSQVVVFVVRYFGGTKLGASGLINAYRTCTADALNNAQIIEKTVQSFFKLSFDYPLMNEVMRVVKAKAYKIHEQYYEENNILVISSPAEQREAATKQFDTLHGLSAEWLYDK